MAHLHRKAAIIILFLLAICIALYIRTIGIFDNHVLFLYDNARDLLFVNKIVIGHKLLLIGPPSGLQGYFHGVFWFYILTIPFIIGGGNPAIMTLFMAISSLLSIVLAFFVVKKISNIYGAFFALLIFCFSAFSFATSRFIWNPYPIVWIIPLYFLLLYLLVHKTTKTIVHPFEQWILPFFYLCTSLIVNFEIIYGICLIPTLFLVTFLTMKNRGNREKVKIGIFSVILFTLPILPMIIFDLRHNFLIFSSLINTIQSGSSSITHADWDKPLSLMQRITVRSIDFYKYSIDYITPIHMLNLLFFLFIPGALMLELKKNKKNILFISVLIFTLTVPLLFFINLKYAVWEYYWIGNPPLYGLLLAYCFSICIMRLKKIKFSLLVLLILFFSFNPLLLLTDARRLEIKEGSQTLKTQKEIVNYIYHDAKNTQFSVYVQTPPVYDYIYRYLFLWTARNTGKNPPLDEKQHLIYLIREPSGSDPSGSFFRQQVIRTKEKVIKVKIFPGEVVVEKILTLPKEKKIDQNYFPAL